MKRMVFGLVMSLLAVWAYADGSAEAFRKESFWKIYTDALRGDRVAQYQAGVIFERGLGVDKNETMAAQWYEKSAQQGYVDAQYNIGIMYAAGRGVERNDAIAMMWFAMAAKQGDIEARQLLLGMIDEKAKRKPEMTNVESDDSNQGAEAIAPVTLVCKAQAQVCSRYDGQGECTAYKEKTVLTSSFKRGRFYKVTGIVTNRKWNDYKKEGWIDEEMVEIRN